MSICNLSKIISQKEPYVVIWFIGVVQCYGGMKFGKKSGIERMSEMPLWSAGDKDAEGEMEIVEDNSKDVALHGRSVTLI